MTEQPSSLIDKSDKIKQQRKSLFDRGNIKFVRISKYEGRMVAINPNDAAAVTEAEQYNWLAEQHARIKS